MTPHGILEDMTQMLDQHRETILGNWDGEMLIAALDMLRDAVHFEFGPTTPLTDHGQFADELLERALFRLPFDTVLYTGNCIPHTGILARHEVKDGLLRRLHWFTVGPAMSTDGSIRFSIPMLWGEMVPNDGLTDMLNGTVNWKSLTASNHASRTTKRPWTDGDYQLASEKVVSFLCSATVLMMSKDIDIETVAAPDRLNAKRAKKGRLPIGERRVVRIKLERLAAYVNAAADFANRASPRMHFRRGHFRTIVHGRDTPLVVPVAPSIVNAVGDTKPLAKTYEVR